MPDCDNNCSACGQDCPSRQNPQSFQVACHPNSRIKKVIGVVSGKGGVGKSLTTSLLAVNARRAGKKVAIIDADITGPSIPTIFGLKELAYGNENTIFPVETKTGIKTISLNLLMEDPAEPVIWRGSLISGIIKQFWSDVDYGEIDELYVDMPPGTGDVPLTVFQSLPVDGIVIVTSPQDLVSLIVEKALRMAKMMNVPVLGLVQNMSYMKCPCCGELLHPFGDKSGELASEYGIPVIEELPIDPSLAVASDEGTIEDYEGDYLQKLSDSIHE